MENRRELKSRSTNWAKWASHFLAKCGLTPNSISILSIVFSILACLSCYLTQHERLSYVIGLGLTILFIQLRLLCNLMDGMLAIEFGMKGALGDIFNEIPDRFADTFIIIGFSLIGNNLTLGLWCSLLALATAYLRVLGGSLGLKQKFLGPMAKQHRMFFVSVLCLALAITQNNIIVYYGLIFILIGTSITVLRRMLVIAKDLQEKPL